MSDSNSVSSEPEPRREWLTDFIMSLAIAILLMGIFRAELFSNDSVSKMDLLSQYDFWQNTAANAPLKNTDDPSSVLTHIPNERFAAKEGAAGNVPLWNQLNGGGRPFFGEFQTLDWSFFHSWFPSKSLRLYNLGIILKLYLAGLGTYLLSRRLSLSAAASFTAASAFMLAGRNLHWVELCNNVFFYPWLILIFLWMAAKSGFVRAVLAGLVTAAAAYNIHPETYACATITAGITCIDEFYLRTELTQFARAWSSVKRWLIWCGLAAAIAFLVAAPLLLCFGEFIANSSSYKFEEHSPEILHWWNYLASLVVPLSDINIYCGIVLGLLLPLGIVVAWKTRKVLVLCFAVMLLFCIRPGGLETIFEKQPFLYMLPEYPLAGLILLQAIISAYGFDQLLTRNFPKLDSKWGVFNVRTLLVLIPALTSIAILIGQTPRGCAVISQYLDAAYAQPVPNWIFWLSTLFTISLCLYGSCLSQRRTSALRTLSVMLCVANTLLLVCTVSAELHPRDRIAYKSSNYLNLVQSEGARMVATGCEIFQPDTNLIYGVDDFRSLAPIHPQRYARFAEEAQIKPRISFLQECPVRLNKLFDLASVKYVLSDSCVESAGDSDADKNSTPLSISTLQGSQKLAEGLRLDKCKIRYTPEHSGVDVALTFCIRGDLQNKFYCRLALLDANKKMLSSNVWPFQAINEQGTELTEHRYETHSSLFVPIEVESGSSISVVATIRDGWTTENLRPTFIELGRLKVETAPQTGRFRIVKDNENGFALFRNFNALPRAYLVHSAKFFRSPTEVLQRLGDQEIDWNTTAIIEGVEPENLKSARKEKSPAHLQPEACKILDRDSDSVLLYTVLNEPGYLILTDTFFPGWTATIDGQRTPILPANYAFRAVSLKEGRHTVLFNYEPKLFSLGLFLMRLGIALGTLLIGTEIVLERRKRTAA